MAEVMAARGERCRLEEGEGGHPPRASDIQHSPQVDGVDGLRARVLLMRCAPPLRSRFRLRHNPLSQGQRHTHTHTPGHVPERGPACDPLRGGFATPPQQIRSLD